MRFSLMSLLLAFAVVWSSLATFGIAGLAVAAVLLGIAAYLRSARDRPEAMAKGVAATVILFFICIIHPVLPAAREAARRLQCLNNLKQIALALHRYHDTLGSFPPAYVPGPDGKPWHSWRVLILPFIEQEGLYKQYDFDEPWDGPNNGTLARSRPLLYRCPAEPNSQTPPTTNYLAVVGPKAAWTGSEPRGLGEFRDGTDSTIIVVEVAGSGIHWMEPRDLSFDEARRGINPPGQVGISSHHPLDHGYFYHEEPGANVALANGHVRVLGDWLDQPTLEAMLTIDGREQIDVNAIPLSRPRPYWSRILAPVVLIVAFLILVVRRRRPPEAKPEGASPCDSA